VANHISRKAKKEAVFVQVLRFVASVLVWFLVLRFFFQVLGGFRPGMNQEKAKRKGAIVVCCLLFVCCLISQIKDDGTVRDLFSQRNKGEAERQRKTITRTDCALRT